MTAGGIGLAQFNVQLPRDMPPGSRLGFEIRYGGVGSTPVWIAVGAGEQ